MSFRIEDILRNTNEAQPPPPLPKRLLESREPEVLSPMFPVSPYSTFSKFFYPDPYLDKVLPFPSRYLPPRIYPFYPRNVSTILPYTYPHYTKRKGGQVRFTTSQTDALEKRFRSNKYLSPEDRKTLADGLKLSDRQVKTWFQNRRAKWRRCNSVSSNSDRIQDEDSDTDVELNDDKSIQIRDDQLH